MTVLPGGCVPSAPYSLLARQEALQQIADGVAIEQAAPDCLDPDRIADPSTLRRWVWRRIESLALFICRGPTILAWDWRAATSETPSRLKNAALARAFFASPLPSRAIRTWTGEKR
jgi:hypothetical protein